MIRYRLNDVLRPRGTTWASGPYLELEELVGRSEIRPVFVNRLGETLEAGDVIASGTMAGVGPIVPGDSVTITIQNVGTMTLPVALA